MVKVRDVYGSFKTIRFLSRPLHLVYFCVYFQHFWCHFKCTQAKQVQTHPNSNFQIPLCILCLLCTCMSKFDRVLKTHSNHNNSNNNSGRLFKFTSEVTLVGPHIVSKVATQSINFWQSYPPFCTRQLLSRPSP